MSTTTEDTNIFNQTQEHTHLSRTGLAAPSAGRSPWQWLQGGRLPQKASNSKRRLILRGSYHRSHVFLSVFVFGIMNERILIPVAAEIQTTQIIKTKWGSASSKGS